MLNEDQFNKDWNKIFTWLAAIKTIGFVRRYIETKRGAKVLGKIIERKIGRYSKKWYLD